jgi:hypothetical protein
MHIAKKTIWQRKLKISVSRTHDGKNKIKRFVKMLIGFCVEPFKKSHFWPTAR